MSENINTDEKKAEEVKLSQPVEESKQVSEAAANPDIALNIAHLKTELDELNQEKEKWFARKEELKQKIADLIKKVREVKSRNDVFADKIKEIKQKRDKQNEVVKALISKIKEINTTKKTPQKGKSPEVLKHRIDQLQMKIETGGVPFKEEKKLMKQIKDLKKEYNEVKGVSEAGAKAGELSKQIDDAKKVAKDLHDKVTDTAKENREGYKEFMTLSKEINKVKKEQEDAFEKFIQFKQKFSDKNKIMKKLFGDKTKIRKAQKKKKEEHEQEKRVLVEKKLEEKKEEVEQKIKKRKVLTTEDLIAFQGKEE